MTRCALRPFPPGAQGTGIRWMSLSIKLTQQSKSGPRYLSGAVENRATASRVDSAIRKPASRSSKDRYSPPPLAARATVGNLRLDHERRLVEAPGFALVEHPQGQ